MPASSTDRIDKHIEIRAPLSRVWRALTDHREFSRWFCVNLDGPFVPGRTVRGPLTYPGYEHVIFAAIVQKMEPERYFSFNWHPYAVEPGVDYSKETPTLVEFFLEATPTGTLLRLCESGFDAVPVSRRDVAFRMNSSGWIKQLNNIEQHVARDR